MLVIMSHKLPSTKEVRTRITQAEKEPLQMGLMYGFLIAGRASEVVCKAYPSDKGTTPRGPFGRDFEVTEARVNGDSFEVVVFNVKTSKRGGIPRSIGLPLDPDYEPWARTLLNYFERFDEDDHVFPYTRQDLFDSSKEVFKDDYVYPIEEYTTKVIDQSGFDELLIQVPKSLKHLVRAPAYLRTETKVHRHTRTLRLHGALRHHRLMELTQKFGFNREDRKVYAGHTMDVTDRYTHLDWRSYFPKLLIKSY